MNPQVFHFEYDDDHFRIVIFSSDDAVIELADGRDALGQLRYNGFDGGELATSEIPKFVAAVIAAGHAGPNVDDRDALLERAQLAERELSEVRSCLDAVCRTLGAADDDNPVEIAAACMTELRQFEDAAAKAEVEVERLTSLIHNAAIALGLTAGDAACLAVAAPSDRAKAAFLDAGSAFWEDQRLHYGSRAVVWVRHADGRLAIFTRGEYAAQLLAAVPQQPREIAGDLKL